MIILIKTAAKHDYWFLWYVVYCWFLRLVVQPYYCRTCITGCVCTGLIISIPGGCSGRCCCCDCCCYYSTLVLHITGIELIIIIRVVILVPVVVIAVAATATISFVVIKVTILILLVVVGEITTVISGKMKNARESLIKLIFNSNLLFIVRSYHNHQHHAIIVEGVIFSC